MLSAKDLQMIEKVLDRKFVENNAILREEMRSLLVIQKCEIRDEVRGLLRATEHKIISEITEFIGGDIVPQIDDLEGRVFRLEQRVA